MSDDAGNAERIPTGANRAETGVDVQPVDTGALPIHAEPAPDGDGKGKPVLELRDVSTHYGLVAVLRNVNVQIYAGEMVCLLGGTPAGRPRPSRRSSGTSSRPRVTSCSTVRP